MAPDDEVVFGRACDESISSFELVQRLVNEAGPRSAELSLAVAEFELHGATLKNLVRWYPDEAHIRTALIDWELLDTRLSGSLLV